MNRREFIQNTLQAGVSASLVGSLSSCDGQNGTSASKDRPNILLIMSDEHNANLMGCSHDPFIDTPNLDKLSQAGILFENAYCNSPLCGPSRLSFTGGKLPSKLSAWGNTSMLESNNIPSIANTMKDAGYDSYLCGKMHYDKTRDYGFELYGTANYDFYHKTGLGENNGGRRDADDLTPLPGNSKRINEIGTGDSWLLRYDRSVTKDAAKFLENRKADDKPFFFMTGYLAPHFPLIVPEEYWEKYRGKIPLPELPPNNDENLPLNYKHLQTAFNIEGLDPEITTKAREIYYGLTNWFDGQIGELLDAFEENTEVKDNTIIIYTSDHGESMGEHGLWWKNTMYDCSSKVPLIVSWPKKWKGNQRRTEVCSLLDVVQTINDIGQAKTPDDWDGDSLLPLLNDPSANWDNEVICEYYGHNVASGYTMLRKDNFKYVYHTSPKKGYPEVFELYDVKSDPKELKNLANDTAYQSIKEKLHKRLMEKLTEHPNESEKRCRADYIKGYNRTGFKNPNPFA